MFGHLTFSQQQLLYLGLKSLIESKAGFGFIKGDLAHPVYVKGSEGADPDRTEYLDSPHKNTLFLMLSELCRELKSCGIEEMGYAWWYDFSNWQDFCRFAVSVARGEQP